MFARMAEPELGEDGEVIPQPRSHPSLQCNHAFADSLAAALDGRESAQPSLSVWVDWGSSEAEPGPFTLTARHEGEELASAHVEASHQELALSLSITSLSMGYGSTVVMELRWPGGARHLHVLRPLVPSCLAFSGLVSVAPSAADIAAAELTPSMAANIRTMPASVWWRSVSTVALEVETLCAPVRPLRLSSVERGLGVEIELVTAAGPGEKTVEASVHSLQPVQRLDPSRSRLPLRRRARHSAAVALLAP